VLEVMKAAGVKGPQATPKGLRHGFGAAAIQAGIPLNLLHRNEYQMKIPYRTDADLDKIMDDLLREIAGEADDAKCFSESEALLEDTDRRW
jgi:hypothetical protein